MIAVVGPECKALKCWRSSIFLCRDETTDFYKGVLKQPCVVVSPIGLKVHHASVGWR